MRTDRSHVYAAAHCAAFELFALSFEFYSVPQNGISTENVKTRSLSP